MKKTLLLALALIAVGCAEPIPRNLDDLSRQGPQYVDRETLEPYSGPAYRMSEDDPTQIVLRVNLRDGRFHGDFEDFAPEGYSLGLYQTGTYRDGQLEGRYEYFYPSGVLRGRGTYDNDERDGPCEGYYENGELRLKLTFVASEQDGPFEFYYENGQLWERGHLEHGGGVWRVDYRR
jgi:antitoxin component YwqK of YwqJK toxin-antitoxin module